MIGLASYGVKLNSLKDPEAKFRKYGKESFGTYNFKRAIELATIWLTPQYTSLFGSKFILESGSNFYRTAFQDILDERQKSNVKRNDLIDLMIQLRDNEDNDAVSHGFSKHLTKILLFNLKNTYFSKKF